MTSNHSFAELPVLKPIKMTFKNQWTNRPIYKGEISHRPSMTIPDQSLDMRTIYDKFVRQQPIPALSQEAHFYGEEDFPEPSMMDKQDSIELSRTYKTIADEQKQKLADIQSDKIKTKKAADKAAAISEYKAQQAAKSSTESISGLDPKK